jgi:xanthine/uracil permease
MEKEKIKLKSGLFKKIIGIIFIVLGLLALLTPLTPGSWLIPIGLELIGIRLAFVDKIKARFFPKKNT